MDSESADFAQDKRCGMSQMKAAGSSTKPSPHHDAPRLNAEAEKKNGYPKAAVL